MSSVHAAASSTRAHTSGRATRRACEREPRSRSMSPAAALRCRTSLYEPGRRAAGVGDVCSLLHFSVPVSGGPM